MENPFVTTGYVSAEYFCDREKETSDLVRLLVNGNNVALISPRRYGKTDLLRHCFAQPAITERYYTFIVDIYSTKSVAEMVAKLGSSILETLKPKGRRVWERFVSALSSVKHGISFDVNGQPSWTLSVGDLKSPTTTLDEIFAYIQQADRPCLIAIDEFQQITKYADKNIEAALRTYVQYCSNAKFVFSGSRQHLMATMFTSPARPFYQSVTLYGLNLIPIDKYKDFCLKHFRNSGKNLDLTVVDLLYDRFDGITYYVQRVMNELFARTTTGNTCNTDDVETSVKSIIDDSSLVYEDLLYQLPEKQSLTLMAIAKEGKATNLTSGEFVNKYGLISPSSVKSAIPALIDKGLLTMDKGVYQVYDKFFNLWLLRNMN
ncbi:MAG: ATP-binding protein [Paludibacteraceae bacterium]|nr:ATP-binding protein [Paludibacteraceae bacterium]